MASEPVSSRDERRALIEVSPDVFARFRDPRLVLAAVCIVIGAAAVFVGYLGVSNTLDPGEQLPYVISGGIGGLFLLGLGAALWFAADTSAAREDVRRLREDIAALQATVDALSERAAPPSRRSTSR